MQSGLVSKAFSEKQTSICLEILDLLDLLTTSSTVESGESCMPPQQLPILSKGSKLIPLHALTLYCLYCQGLIAQNRAIEGDTVYIKVHPSSKWPLLRGTRPEDAKSESSSLSGLSSVLENLNLGTSRGGMFGLEDSSDDISDRGSFEQESVLAKSLGGETGEAGSVESQFSGPGGSVNGRDGSEESGPRGGVCGTVERGAEEAVGPVDVQRELDELFSQLAGGSGEKGPTGSEESVRVGAGNITDGFEELGSTPPLKVEGSCTTSGSAEGDDLDVSESFSEGDLVSSDGVPVKECRPTAMSQAVERLAAELKAAPNRRPTGFVVGIAEFSARREALVGYLQVPSKPSKPAADTPVKGLFRDNGNGSPTVTAFTSPSVTLMPADPRMPKMTVWVDGLPDGLKERVREGDPSVNTTLVAARIDCWKAQHYQPLATVRQSLGQAGEIETETAAIMFMHNIHGPDFPEEALECLPATPWTIPKDEIARRRDLRGERIFTIDPPTARDLDDAVSVKRLGNGNFEVGVHIADVSFFVAPGTGLDKVRVGSQFYMSRGALLPFPRNPCTSGASLDTVRFRHFHWD
jgi:exoribonuclease R